MNKLRSYSTRCANRSGKKEEEKKKEEINKSFLHLLALSRRDLQGNLAGRQALSETGMAYERTRAHILYTHADGIMYNNILMAPMFYCSRTADLMITTKHMDILTLPLL